MSKNIKKDIGILLLIAPFLMPSFLLTFESINTLIKIWKICAGLWSIVWVVYRDRISLFLVMLSLFYGIIIGSAILHGNSGLDGWMGLVFLWLVCFWTEEEDDRNHFFKMLIIWNGLLLLINLGTMLIYPDGMYATKMYSSNWFLGYKNVYIRRIIPTFTIIISRVCLQERKMSIFEKTVIICSVLITLLSKSIISLIGLAVFMGTMILLHFDFFRKMLRLGKLFFAYVITDVVFLSLNLKTLLEPLLVDLGKTGSASGRFGIWEDAIQAFHNSPLIGYGQIDSDLFHVGFNVTHPHNLLLYYALLGGICCILVFIFCLFWIDSMCRINVDMQMQKINCYFVASYLAFFVMAYGESLIGANMFIPFLIVMYNLNKNTSSYEQEKYLEI